MGSRDQEIYLVGTAAAARDIEDINGSSFVRNSPYGKGYQAGVTLGGNLKLCFHLLKSVIDPEVFFSW